MAENSMRNRVREEVYGHVRDSPGTTRGELVRVTGISKSAITHSVGRLIDDGRIIETEPKPTGVGSGSGRPGLQLFPAPTDDIVAGIDFGHRHVGVAIGDSLGAEIDSEIIHFNVDLDAEGAMAIAAAALERLKDKHSVTEVAAVTAGVPGPIDRATGVVQSQTILSGWVGRHPALELAELLGAPVEIENDTVLGATGELLVGAARGHANVIYLKVSDGIGAALIVDGKTYRGDSGLAGEIGHTRLEGNTELCRCGNRGCLEAVISIQAIIDQLRHVHQQPDLDSLDDISQTDPVTARIFNEAGRTIGRVLADQCNLLNPSLLIVGGHLGTAHPAIVEGVRAGVRRFAQSATAEHVQIVPAGLDCLSEMAGALQLAARDATSGRERSAPGY